MPKLIIFGVDGGAFEILRPLMAHVLLPNFARVMEREWLANWARPFRP